MRFVGLADSSLMFGLCVFLSLLDILKNSSIQIYDILPSMMFLMLMMCIVALLMIDSFSL